MMKSCASSMKEQNLIWYDTAVRRACLFDITFHVDSIDNNCRACTVLFISNIAGALWQWAQYAEQFLATLYIHGIEY